MKKILLILCLFLFIFPAFSSDAYELTNVPKDFIGFFVPIELLHFRSEFGMQYDFLSLDYTADHPNLYLSEKKCSAHSTDGYAIRASEFSEFGFITTPTGKYIIDSHGNAYKKVPYDANMY